MGVSALSALANTAGEDALAHSLGNILDTLDADTMAKISTQMANSVSGGAPLPDSLATLRNDMGVVFVERILTQGPLAFFSPGRMARISGGLLRAGYESHSLLDYVSAALQEDKDLPVSPPLNWGDLTWLARGLVSGKGTQTPLWETLVGDSLHHVDPDSRALPLPLTAALAEAAGYALGTLGGGPGDAVSSPPELLHLLGESLFTHEDALLAIVATKRGDEGARLLAGTGALAEHLPGAATLAGGLVHAVDPAILSPPGILAAASGAASIADAPGMNEPVNDLLASMAAHASQSNVLLPLAADEAAAIASTNSLVNAASSLAGADAFVSSALIPSITAQADSLSAPTLYALLSSLSTHSTIPPSLHAALDAHSL